MTIETTQKAFNLLFTASHIKSTENLKLARKQHYTNYKIEQSGILVHNYVSKTCQYYLIDINA